MSIVFEKVGFVYGENTPFEETALHEIHLKIEEGNFYALVGHTGSGKSTVIQLLNGLLRPTKGMVYVDDTPITKNNAVPNLKHFRQKIGIVFQFPESQLFEETVEKDLCFGPINFGFSEEAAKKSARKALRMVGLSEDFLSRSPFTLSGGEMRKVSIAGVLAFCPAILVLDEPTVGLDPKSQKEMMDLFWRLHKEENMTIVLVTHQMDDVAMYANQVIVMANGQVIQQGTPVEIFSNESLIHATRLQLPKVTQLQKDIEQLCGMRFEKLCLTADELAEEIRRKQDGM